MCNNHQILTHSRMSCFRDCPRKHYIRYELGIKPDGEDSVPRKFGSAMHLAFEMDDKGLPVVDAVVDIEDAYLRESVLATFSEHTIRYFESDPKPIASELEFDLPLINPETGRPSTTWRLQGKIDRIVEIDDGRLALMEYKTTTQDFSPGAEYWQRLHMDQQLSIYVIAARELGYNIETILYDVTRRPQLRPKMATPEDARKYKKDGELYANQRDVDETPDEFGVRVLADIESRPEHYFSRIEIARLDQDLDDCRAELWMQQKSIRTAQTAGYWYRNPNNCHGFFTCDYLPVCLHRDLDKSTPLGFVRDDNIHPELGGATDQG